MIENIIEESYKRKARKKVKKTENESEKNELFRKIKNGRFRTSLFVNSKYRNGNKTINSSIDNLLWYTVIDTGNKELNEQIFKLRKEKFMSGSYNKPKKPTNKHLFKSRFSLFDKIQKTKIQEFSFMKKEREIHLNSLLSRMNQIKNKNMKNIKSNMSNSSVLNFVKDHDYTNYDLAKKGETLSVNNSDTFFITKIPQTNLKQNKTICVLSNRKKYLMSKVKKFRKIHSLIKKSNSQMLDIYTGLNNIKQNKIEISDNIINLNSNSQNQEHEKNNKLERTLRNIDKFINLNAQKSQSAANINRKFKILFKKIFNNKKYTDEKFDPTILMNPSDKIMKGGYKEIKLDNNFNRTLGQRIWIKKSTANIVSYGKTCQKIPDDIFYHERKRILDIYPKIEEDAKISVKRKKIAKRNPLLKRLVHNINRLNDVYLEEYDAVKRLRKKMQQYKISY